MKREIKFRAWNGENMINDGVIKSESDCEEFIKENKVHLDKLL